MARCRQWREDRRLSQLELASRAAVSTRHLSFVETGKARPTAAMIERLADQLDVPLRERNDLLLAGGFAPRYGVRGLDDDDLAPVLDGLRRVLDAYLPAPALLLDDRWDVVDANTAAFQLMADCDPALLEPPINAIRVSLHPGGLAPRIRNLPVWGANIHQRVRMRAERRRDPALWALAEEIAGYVDVRAQPPATDPVLAVELETEDQGCVRFFGLATQLETATDVTLAELHLEAFLPADAASQEWLIAALR
ncbi:helix-turn-helix domain-containing protein [Nocardioides sp.]|uniref:helix-turn-helix domain-containing protein n=1 Tax=Nocardioides sp. TaxID=35761 RepID=UPI0035273F67